MKKPKHPAFSLLWLVMIPVQLLLDAGMITLGTLADTAIANPEALGHPAPAFTLIAGFLALIFIVVIFLLSVTLTIIRFVVLKKKREKYMAGIAQ